MRERGWQRCSPKCSSSTAPSAALALLKPCAGVNVAPAQVLSRHGTCWSCTLMASPCASPHSFWHTLGSNRCGMGRSCWVPVLYPVIKRVCSCSMLHCYRMHPYECALHIWALRALFYPGAKWEELFLNERIISYSVLFIFSLSYWGRSVLVKQRKISIWRKGFRNSRSGFLGTEQGEPVCSARFARLAAAEPRWAESSRTGSN